MREDATLQQRKNVANNIKKFEYVIMKQQNVID